MCSFLGSSSKETACLKQKWLRKQTTDWRRVVVTRVWLRAEKDFAIKYHPVERYVVLLLKHL